MMVSFLGSLEPVVSKPKRRKTTMKDNKAETNYYLSSCDF